MALRLEGSAGTWVLPLGVTVIGRGDDCGVRINDPRLSRHHARLEVMPSRLLAHDMGSSNGVLVNGDRITTPALLLPGDEVVCGPVRLVVRSNDDAPPPAVVADATPGIPTAEVMPRRSRTEQMDSQEVAHEIAKSRQRAHPPADSAPAPSGKLNPAIAAAVTAESTALPERREGSTSMHPSEMARALGSTSALSPNRFHTPSAPSEAQGTGKLFPSEAPSHSSAALEFGHLIAAVTAKSTLGVRGLRLLAGVADPLVSLTLGLAVGLALVVGGATAALLMAGAGVVNDTLLMPSAPQAEVGDLAGYLLLPKTWLGIDGVARQLHELASPWPFLIFFLSLAAGTVAAEACLLWRLVTSTVQHGGPWLHRRLGLRVVVQRNGYHPGWLRATARWSLLALTWPLALVTVGFGWRGIHDLLSGCEVRVQR